MKRMLKTLCWLALFAFAGAHAAVIKIATVAPEGSGWMKQMRAGAAAIKERTQGRVEVKYFPGGVMGNDVAVLRKMKLGQLQGGAFSGAELSPVVPDAQIYSLPFLFREQAEVDYVRARADDTLKDAFRKKDLEVMGMAGGGFAFLMSTKPIRTRDDLKATKVWVPQADRIAQVTFEVGGVKPVALPLADVYTALSTGMIETAGNTPSGSIAFQWHTRIKHVVEFPLTYVMGIMALDKKAFDKIAPDDQKIMLEEFAKAFTAIDTDTRKDNEAALTALTKQGVTLFKPEAKEQEFWISIGLEARKRLLDEGAYTPELFKRVNDALEEFRAQSATAAAH